MGSWDIVCSLSCLYWDLAPLFHVRLVKYKGCPTTLSSPCSWNKLFKC